MRSLLIAFFYFFHTSVCLEPRNGYVVNRTSGVGYKIMYQSQTWPNARDKCKEDGAKLAVPETKEDFLFIQKLVRAMTYRNITDTDFKLIVWLGINNIEDYRTWVTVDGKKLQDNEFNTWARGNGEGFSDAVEEPHCGGLDPANFGLRDYWCHRRQPYVCQMNLKLNNSSVSLP